MSLELEENVPYQLMLEMTLKSFQKQRLVIGPFPKKYFRQFIVQTKSEVQCNQSNALARRNFEVNSCAVPGEEQISVRYGVRLPKYILLHTRKDIAEKKTLSAITQFQP